LLVKVVAAVRATAAAQGLLLLLRAANKSNIQGSFSFLFSSLSIERRENEKKMLLIFLRLFSLFSFLSLRVSLYVSLSTSLSLSLSLRLSLSLPFSLSLRVSLPLSSYLSLSSSLFLSLLFICLFGANTKDIL